MIAIRLISVVFFLLPLLLVTGPFLPNLAVTLGAIIFLIFFLVTDKEKLKLNFFLIFFLFWIYIVLNSIFLGNLDSIKTSLAYFRFGILILIFVYLFENNNRFTKIFKITIFFTIFLLIFDSLLQFFSGENLIGYKKDSRISSFFNDEKILGSFLTKIIPIGIFFYYLEKKEIKLNIFIIILLLTSLYVIVLSNERSALGLYILYIFLLFIVLLDKFKKILFLFIFFLSILFSVIISSELFHKRYVADLVSQFKKTDEPISVENLYFFTVAHDAMFRTSFNMFKDKPITGHGTKMFRYKCNDIKYSYENSRYSCNTHPHNYYVQMLSENGFIGFFILSLLYIFFIKEFFLNLIKKNNKKKLLNLSIIPNLVMLWPFITHGNFFNSWISIIIYLNLSIYLCAKYNYIKLFKTDEV